jgi:hypothetical protein
LAIEKQKRKSATPGALSGAPATRVVMSSPTKRWHSLQIQIKRSPKPWPAARLATHSTGSGQVEKGRKRKKSRSQPVTRCAPSGSAEWLAFVQEEAWTVLRRWLEELTDAEMFWQPVADCWTVHQDEDGRWVIDYAWPEPEPSPFTTSAWRTANIEKEKAVVRFI